MRRPAPRTLQATERAKSSRAPGGRGRISADRPMRTPTPYRGRGDDPLLTRTADQDAADLDWATCQLQREHDRVFRAIDRLRATANRIRIAVAK